MCFSYDFVFVLQICRIRKRLGLSPCLLHEVYLYTASWQVTLQGRVAYEDIDLIFSSGSPTDCLMLFVAVAERAVVFYMVLWYLAAGGIN